MVQGKENDQREREREMDGYKLEKDEDGREEREKVCASVTKKQNCFGTSFQSHSLSSLPSHPLFQVREKEKHGESV